MHAGKLLAETVVPALPALRFDIAEAAQILRMSRAQLYNRICEGTILPQKDGARTYITPGRTRALRRLVRCNTHKREERSSRVAPATTVRPFAK